MQKRIFVILLIISTILFKGFLYAQSNEFVISGKIKFSKSGKIFVQLQDKDQFESKSDNQSTASLIVEIEEQGKKKGEASFEFKNISGGTYVIQVFQDVNGSGKLDFGKFGPKEPWGNYRFARPFFRSPTFEEMKFELKEDICDIEIKLK